MPRTKITTGVVVQGDDPNWGPLEAAVGLVLVGWFMWMYEVRLADGTRLDAYKHQDTRTYLHLTEDRRAFTYRCDSSYGQVDLAGAVEALLEDWHHLRDQHA